MSDTTLTYGTVIPTLRYKDAPAAIAWLCDALGFERNLVVEAEDGRVEHAQLTFGGAGMIMLGSEGDADGSGLAWPAGSASLYLIADDVDGLHARALAAGGEEVRAPVDQDYGGRGSTVRDPEGNLWSVGSYRP